MTTRCRANFMAHSSLANESNTAFIAQRSHQEKANRTANYRDDNRRRLFVPYRDQVLEFKVA